jgi:hypothetical protein
LRIPGYSQPAVSNCRLSRRKRCGPRSAGRCTPR